ncbi:GlxA family transcriptional regulator [Pseudoalteromonas peptidolytica]|uniref:GlxA family transcriptional regulator n=1 Tax=Pseudoalteromonas peptidolytica TaxID=61150 RepID=UPI00298E1A7D|nr:helix-turn-helix domain-containing protein [Pseudoalteromonas peptidolytica]MDW7549954.1 helix-turn-helix domain-containing protein [Pseudoalteromonas peptidolytica]
MKPCTKIAIVLYRHMLITSVTLPLEMLKAGQAFAKVHLKDAYTPLDIVLCSSHGEAIKADEYITLEAQSDFSALPLYDYIIVPSIWRNPRPIVKQNQELSTSLADAWEAGSTLIGVGTGVCFLASSGLLNGHSATTHWHFAKQFSQLYPNVELKPDYFITQSERIYTIASLNALADVIVHLIELLYGTDAAHHVQQNFSHEIRKPYEEQRYLEGAVDRHADEQIAAIQFWLKNNAADEITLPAVASQFDMSYRTFNRRFKQATGQTAVGYLQQVRVEMCKELLASSNLSIQDIALTCGFNSQGQLSRVFRQLIGKSPSTYRDVVRKKLFS